MMKKSAKSKTFLPPTLSLGIKIAVVVETLACVGSYFVWRKMNKDIDFRYKMYQKAPYILEYYYNIGDKIGGNSSREADYSVWGVQS